METFIRKGHGVWHSGWILLSTAEAFSWSHETGTLLMSYATFLLHASLEETMSPHSAFRALSLSFSFSKTQAFENQKGCLQAVSFPKGFKQLFWNSKIQAMTPLFCLQQTLLLYDPRFRVSLCLMLPEWKTWEFLKRRDGDSKTLFCFPVAIAWNSVPFRVPVLSNGLTAFLHSFPMHFWVLATIDFPT